jgi:hypothetical protein
MDMQVRLHAVHLTDPHDGMHWGILRKMHEQPSFATTVQWNALSKTFKL